LTKVDDEGIIPIVIIVVSGGGTMDTVGIAEIKRSISTIVNRVAFGRERIVLTSRGRPKAALVSIEDLEKLEMLERTSSSPSRAERKAALAMAQAVREMTLVRRDGVPFPDVAEDLGRLREERDLELAGLR
jgi:prevent-host-death family protein